MKLSSTNTQNTEKQSELLHTQLNAENKDDNSEYGESNRIVNIEPVEGTPFKIVTKADEEENKNSFISIGNARLTELQSFGKCKMAIQDKDWNIIMQMILYVTTKLIEEYDQHEGEIKI